MRKKNIVELSRLTLEQAATSRKIAVIVVLDNIRSLQNVGAFFRTCDAFAAERICLCGITATPPNRDIHKSALGAEQSVEWSYFQTTSQCVEELKRGGYTAIAIEQVEGGEMLDEVEVDPEKKYALIFGNEVMGVDDDVLAMCDGAIEIPQAGTKHSINVSVAAGVILWSFFCKLKGTSKN
ncbi:MAG: RNA methyltransferase [Rikenellaceae bacterium]